MQLAAILTKLRHALDSHYEYDRPRIWLLMFAYCPLLLYVEQWIAPSFKSSLSNLI